MQISSDTSQYRLPIDDSKYIKNVVHIGLDDVLLPSSNKPFPEPLLTKFYDGIPFPEPLLTKFYDGIPFPEPLLTKFYDGIQKCCGLMTGI